MMNIELSSAVVLRDQYQITQGKASGIVNDPNQWSEDPQYVVDLVKRVVRVTMETIRIVERLPALNLDKAVAEGVGL